MHRQQSADSIPKVECKQVRKIFMYKNRVINNATRVTETSPGIQRNAHIPHSLCSITQQSGLGKCALRWISGTCFSSFVAALLTPFCIKRASLVLNYVGTT